MLYNNENVKVGLNKSRKGGELSMVTNMKKLDITTNKINEGGELVIFISSCFFFVF